MTSPSFHPLTIRECRRETADTVSIAFDVPADLADRFRFVQGQYLTLKTHIGDEEVRRSYSICSGVGEGEFPKLPPGLPDPPPPQALSAPARIIVSEVRPMPMLQPYCDDESVLWRSDDGLARYVENAL